MLNQKQKSKPRIMLLWKNLSSFLQQLRWHLNKGLRRYWHFLEKIWLFILVGLLISVISNLLTIHTRSSDIGQYFLQYAIVQLILSIPWYFGVPCLVLIALSIFLAWQAAHDGPYYDLRERSVSNYDEVRRNYPGIGAQLDTSTENRNGAAIFDTQVYTERDDAVRSFDGFLNQRTKRVFLLIGRGGTGKSTFLLHRMRALSAVSPLSSTDSAPWHPCVFISGKFQQFSLVHAPTSEDKDQFEATIEKQLGYNLADVLQRVIRHKWDRSLVIFVDALNENLAQAALNYYLTNFAKNHLSSLEEPIYLCVSVREAYWKTHWESEQHHHSAGWLDYVYIPEGGETSEGKTLSEADMTASIQLADFREDEYETAYRRYSQAYSLEGKIRDLRTANICHNPLMLQMFCLTFRNRDIRDLALLRDLDVFDEFANGALRRTAQRVGFSDEPRINGETLPQRAIRALVFELSLGMVRRARAFLTYEEVFAIAHEKAPEALWVDGRYIGTLSGLIDEKSVLRAILDEGIVLEQGDAVIPEGGLCGGIRFVHERYFEYSIGRAIVRRWSQEQLNREEILQDFQDRMRQHDQELMPVGFANLLQGLGMAIVVAESFLGLPQGIEYDLLECLAQNEQFDWNQLACRTVVRFKALDKRSSSSFMEDRKNIQRILQLVDVMTSKDDFVLRWDIEQVILQAASASEGHLVFDFLRDWFRPDVPFSRRLFGAECLGELFKQRKEYRADAVAILEEQVDHSTQLSCWIRRGFMFSISTMLDTIEESTGLEGVSSKVKEDILGLPNKLLYSSQKWWDRSVIICAQLGRDAFHRRLKSWLQWDWEEEDSWIRTNAALALEQASVRGSFTPDTLTLLRRLWGSQSNPHLSWAVAYVLQQVIACPDTPVEMLSAAQQLRDGIVTLAKKNLHYDERLEWVLQITDQDWPINLSEVPTPVAIIYHPRYAYSDLHNHPESKERVESIIDFFDSSRLLLGRQRRELFYYVSPYRFQSSLSDWDAERYLRLVHSPEWIGRVRDQSRQLEEIERLGKSEEKHVVLESDLEVRAGSYEGACLAVRGALYAVDLVNANTTIRLAAALLRPPGHLAGNKICIFNNIAIAARYAQKRWGKEKVLIVDCDAHHGRSTQEIFYDDPNVVYFSTHQAGVHPGTGRFEERGKDKGINRTINIPLPAHAGDRVYEEVLRRILQPILDRFKPDIILVSMGFDAFYHDDFSGLEFGQFSYFALAQFLFQYCQQHREVGVVTTLEGGYDLDTMGQCTSQFMRVFGEWHTPQDPPQKHLGSSFLDTYLQECDAGNFPEPPKGSELSKWLHEFGTSEILINQALW